jgi:hypothetical protein
MDQGLGWKYRWYNTQHDDTLHIDTKDNWLHCDIELNIDFKYRVTVLPNLPTTNSHRHRIND